ncbi:hypothetical protein HQ590_06490, partial [bacterium]|nr:hypothetical protein [bacterium]
MAPRSVADPQEQGAAAGARRSWRSPMSLVIVLALLTIGAFWQRVPGLNPSSLFLDDQWVAVLARDASAAQIASIRPPVPVGFLLLIRPAARLGPGQSWPLQVVPLAAGLLVIPLAGWLAYRWTNSALAGLATALFLALNPTLGSYSVRVKPFTLDALLTVGLLALAVANHRRPGVRGVAILAAAGVGAWFFSFPSMFVSAVLVHCAAWMVWRSVRRQAATAPWLILGLVVVFDLALALFCWGWLRPARSAALVEYWRLGFLAFDSGTVFVRSVRFAAGGFFLGPFPDGAPWLALLVVVGSVRALG